MSDVLPIDQLAQHVVVGLVALVAFSVVVRRVFGVFHTERTPSGGAHACAHCGVTQQESKKG